MAYIKDPDANLDYTIDWAAKGWLASGETISTSTWIVESGLTKTAEGSTSTTATVWLSGGTAGSVYEVTNRIVTNQSRTDDRTIHILVRQR